MGRRGTYTQVLSATGLQPPFNGFSVVIGFGVQLTDAWSFYEADARAPRACRF